MNSVLGTSYTSEDSDLVATEQSYAAMENELQQEIDNIESTHPDRKSTRLNSSH